LLIIANRASANCRDQSNHMASENPGRGYQSKFGMILTNQVIAKTGPAV